MCSDITTLLRLMHENYNFKESKVVMTLSICFAGDLEVCSVKDRCCVYKAERRNACLIEPNHFTCCFNFGEEDM